MPPSMKPTTPLPEVGSTGALKQAPPSDWTDWSITGAGYYALTTFIVLLGVSSGQTFMDPDRNLPAVSKDAFFDCLLNWDGRWYYGIAKHGYQYYPRQRSNVAFFPAYPLAARLVSRITTLPVDVALILISHACLIAAFILAAAYVARRFPDAPRELTDYTLLSLGLLPTTVFFRMAYTEAPFILLTLLVLYGAWRRWPLAVLALLVGLATATRPVGVALIPLLALSLWRRSATRGRMFVRSIWLLPLGCWGLAAFMAFQWFAFDDPLAFARTQSLWRWRPLPSIPQQVGALAILEPVWGAHVPSLPNYWCCTSDTGTPC